MFKHRSTRRTALLGGILALALVGAAVAGMAARAATTAKPKRVAVTEREYRITIAHKLAPGPTTFVVHNAGKITHAFDISGPGIKKLAAGSIAPGKSKTLTVTLKSGTYQVWCPMPGHAALGMKATVTADSATSGAASTPGTTTSSGGGAAWG